VTLVCVFVCVWCVCVYVSEDFVALFFSDCFFLYSSAIESVCVCVDQSLVCTGIRHCWMLERCLAFCT